MREDVGLACCGWEVGDGEEAGVGWLHGSLVEKQDRDAPCGWLDVSDGYCGVDKVRWVVCEEVSCCAGIGYNGGVNCGGWIVWDGLYLVCYVGV